MHEGNTGLMGITCPCAGLGLPRGYFAVSHVITWSMSNDKCGDVQYKVHSVDKVIISVCVYKYLNMHLI